MPHESWTDTAPRFRPPPAVTLFVPVVVALIVQVVPTIAISSWLGVRPVWGTLSTLLAAASALALLAARRWPGPTVVAAAVFTALDLFVPPDAGPPFIALGFAIIGAVVRGARLWAWVSVGAAWLLCVTLGGVFGIQWNPFRVALATLLLAVCFAIGEGMRTRIERTAQRRALMAERRRTAEQDERSRIARELHDVLAHSLSQIAVQSGVGLHLFDREPERAREALAAIRELSATGLDEVRGVLAFLRGDDALATRTAPLTPQPQLDDVPALVAQRSGLGLTVSLDDELGDGRPASAVQSTAYRIVQEALTNVVRHSAATSATVTLAHVGPDLVVSVADDGVGAAGRQEGGGMRGMRERASIVDGTVEVTDAPGATRSGTLITARLPWAGPL
jgi:signal transduction histidine kinase